MQCGDLVLPGYQIPGDLVIWYSQGIQSPVIWYPGYHIPGSTKSP